MTGRNLFKNNKTIIKLGVIIFSILPKFIRIFIWDIISPFSQILFIGIRYLIIKSMAKCCGENVKIGKNVTIISWANLRIGNNVSIHSNCYIDATGQISIGNNVSIAHDTSILSTNHTWIDLTMPIKYNECKFEAVHICDDIWIGCGCRILAGITISDRVIIAAGAVVNKNCNSNAIYGGVPIKNIKEI